MVCIGVAALSGQPARALSEMTAIVQYDCQQAQCSLKCWGTGGNIEFTYRSVTVFQWKEHPRRLWISSDSGQYVVGDDTSCKFEGTPKFKYETVPLGPPPQPQCTCIGNQCFPPGCNTR